MRLKKIDGEKFYQAFSRGGEEVIDRRELLNRINVFPVADGDTGHNLAQTMKSIIERVNSNRSVSKVTKSMAEAALMGSRGNS